MATHLEPHAAPSKAAAISNLVVRTLSEYTGRGPTKARTHISGDVVVVVLQDTLTKGERSLVADGFDDLVLTTRKAFQGTMREELTTGIAEIIGRPVIAFLSDNHLDPDIAVEVFVLGPDGADTSNAADKDRATIAGAAVSRR